MCLSTQTDFVLYPGVIGFHFDAGVYVSLSYFVRSALLQCTTIIKHVKIVSPSKIINSSVVPFVSTVFFSHALLFSVVVVVDDDGVTVVVVCIFFKNQA